MSISHNTYRLSLERKIEIFNKARSLAFTSEKGPACVVEHLDCSVSPLRYTIQMDWDEIIGKLDDRAHMSVIERNSFNADYLEVAFRTGGIGPDYFLTIFIPMADKMEIINLLSSGDT